MTADSTTLLLFICLFTVAFMAVWFLLCRWMYHRDVSPSKENPQGYILAEFWTEAGPRIRRLRPIQVNGWEIKSPEDLNHKTPRYFFNKSAMGRGKYPPEPSFPFFKSLVQADVPIVSWYENNPEPIDPKRAGRMLTGEVLNDLQDVDFLGFLSAVDEEYRKMQIALAKALASKMNPILVYVMLGIAITGAGTAATFAIMAYKEISKLAGG